MHDLARLIISKKRIQNLKNNKLILSREEAHYLNNVLRTKIGQEIYVINGEGYLWKVIKIENNLLEFPSNKSSVFFENKNYPQLGLAISIPKKGFEDILKMCTEIGIDFIQPLYSDHQVKKVSNNSSQKQRWNSIVNESVEQCERLWKPDLFNIIKIEDWISSLSNENILSVSVTRDDNCISLRDWIKTKNYHDKNYVLWNVIGPEGGWSQRELGFFKSKNFWLPSKFHIDIFIL